MSTSFKRLQAEKLAADKALRDLTPLSSIEDANALKDYLQSLNSKTEVSVSSPYDMLNHLICNIQVYQDEIKRLNGKLEGKISTYLVTLFDIKLDTSPGRPYRRAKGNSQAFLNLPSGSD